MGHSLAHPALVQKCILAVINADAYRAQLPVMSEEAWDSISDGSDDSALENDRMEWVGDAMIGGRICFKIHEMFPNEGAGFYSVVRNYVVSNLTFMNLMQKIGAAAATTYPADKTSADVFETMAGALYKEHSQNGLEHEFNAWVDGTFVPLIAVAGAAYRACQCTTVASNASAFPGKETKRKVAKRKTHIQGIFPGNSTKKKLHQLGITEKRRNEIARHSKKCRTVRGRRTFVHLVRPA
ncbi:hypothetical protein K438DRAFT_1224547 [Mycena galopus ATCC 62051]|nr:hypothetical protein K438DRAFT_1224547 [Mycena galopus ATCC 62051]